MTTRANIVLVENGDIVLFYQYSDGYPDGVMPMLRWFVDSIRFGVIRQNIELSSGWLIVYGREQMLKDNDSTNSQSVGYVIPAVSIHSDIEYYYTVDIKSLVVTAHKVVEVPQRRMSELPQKYLKRIEVYHG